MENGFVAGWKGRQNHIMNTYVIATVKSWNIENSIKFISRNPRDVFRLVTEKSELTDEMLREVRPRYIFFPHWSWMIPECIYERYECVVFHMTDLPFGRGGSPLQNLLVRGIYQTKLCALRAGAGADTGPVYLREPLDISEGNADEILRRASGIVFEKMMPCFLNKELVPEEQEGRPVVFSRRSREQSMIPDGLYGRQLYDFIRMLDGEGYPAAFRNIPGGRICFRNARLAGDSVYADAEFIQM